MTGPVMNRRGFTLIELIVVAVILGLLASIAIERFANTKEKTYLAAMKADLRNLITAEVVFSTDSLRFTTVIGSGGLTYSVTTGNTVPSIVLTGDGFTAKMGNTNTARTCVIFMGSTPLAPATNEGEPACS
ncbi:MAG TPA: prepilin-type N-terminal cleavage/methylation domain-containing protein [Gemmatimonadales bacterium]|nr:prepilin-type N-terminal cleavage/methylation domain-containing protein [Gemmatimonadales bacterium]